MAKVNKVSFPGLGIDKLNIDSVAVSIGPIQITWYSLIITTGIVVALLYIWRRFKENDLKTEDLLDMALWVIPMGIIGARLYYVIFEFEHFIGINFGETLLNIIAVWEGGLAIYGGVIAGGITAVLVARHKKLSAFKTLDMLAPAVMVAQSIGRWGNFMNVEAFGGPTTMPWRMCSPKIAGNLYYNGLIDDVGYYLAMNGEIGAHPTFLYESLWNLAGFLIMYFVFVRPKKLYKFEGQMFYSYLIWYGLGRLWVEGLRTDSLYLIDGVIRVSQLVALLSLLAGTGLMIAGFVLLKKKREVFFAIPIKETVAEKKEDNKQKETVKNGTNNQRKRSSSKGKRKNKM